MVLSQHRGFRFSFAEDDTGNSPNPLRIAVTSTALALHAVALLVLLAPVAMPPAPVVDEPEPTIKLVPIEPKPVIVDTKKEEPTAKADPKPVASKPVLNNAVETPIVTQRPTDDFVPDVAVAIADPVPTGNIEPPAPSPVQLAYLNAPPPPYPRAAQTQHREGMVMLQITVDLDGRPIAVEIAQSSGHRDLDAAARAHVLKHWRFQPAMKDGHAIQAIGMVPINFTLN
ncbi:TonB family protein [Luteimonas gilva]|uniref:Protein TonB n=1 Tax=Luteimonas gilva TaxID=2572684 RepID=A0A4V5ZQW1_9GAMM|nr:energy transducer TonB [Luteimonas gilva]TKR32803.1 TonB family protein [Luteimonas gilva]